MVKVKTSVVWLLYKHDRYTGVHVFGVYRTKALALESIKYNQQYFPKCDFTVDCQRIIDEET